MEAIADNMAKFMAVRACWRGPGVGNLDFYYLTTLVLKFYH